MDSQSAMGGDEPRHDDGGVLDGIGLGMGNGETVHHAGGTLLLTGVECSFHRVAVIGDAEFEGLVRKQREHLVLGRAIEVEQDLGGLDEFLHERISFPARI